MLAFIRRHPSVLTLFVVVLVLGVAELVFSRAIARRSGWIIYTFIDDHLPRSIGSMRVFGSWGADLPYYALDEKGSPIRMGTFKTDRPISFVYGALWKSAIVRYTNIDLPWTNAPEHTRLLGALI